MKKIVFYLLVLLGWAWPAGTEEALTGFPLRESDRRFRFYPGKTPLGKTVIHPRTSCNSGRADTSWDSNRTGSISRGRVLP